MPAWKAFGIKMGQMRNHCRTPTDEEVFQKLTQPQPAAKGRDQITSSAKSPIETQKTKQNSGNQGEPSAASQCSDVAGHFREPIRPDRDRRILRPAKCPKYLVV